MPGTSCSQSASSVRPCPWWRVHWDPWLQPHPPCRKSATGWRVRLHGKINKYSLRVAIGRYTRKHERRSHRGREAKGKLGPARERTSRHCDLSITSDRFVEIRRMQTDIKKRQIRARWKQKKLVISIAFYICGLLIHSWENTVPFDLWVAVSLFYPPDFGALDNRYEMFKINSLPELPCIFR